MRFTQTPGNVLKQIKWWYCHELLSVYYMYPFIIL